MKWPDQSGQMRNVTANDLFRAVHDAFGHGLEGAPFRARGEENAWQAHVRLFTGPAVAAITSETRGQNSWLNYGPYGDKNRSARVEDTVFAEQKVGLMPEWTWTEGRSPDFDETSETEPIQQSKIKRGLTGGAAFAQFFADVVNTEGGGSSIKDVSEALQLPVGDYKKELDAYVRYGTTFQKHIMSSIPAFVDARIRALRGMVESAKILGRGGKEVSMLDITSSEGYFTKAFAQLAQDAGVKATADALDAGPAFKREFEKAPQVKGVKFLLQAWGESFEDPTTGRVIPLFEPNKKYGVIYEGMGFQFFTSTRDKEIAEVKRIMEPNGLFVTMEKFKNPDYAKREVAKDKFKARFFTEKQLKEKAATVLYKSEESAVGMADYQVDRKDYEKILSDNFKFVVQIYSSGNFAGYYASDSIDVINAALKATGDTTTSFNEEPTPGVISWDKKQGAPQFSRIQRGLDEDMPSPSSMDFNFSDPTEGSRRDFRIAERVLESTILPQSIKDDMKRLGTKYFQKALKITSEQADSIINAFEQAGELNELYYHMMDGSIEMNPDVRVAVNAQLAKKYARLSNSAEGEIKDILLDRVSNILYRGAIEARNAGRAVNAQKLWADVIGTTPEVAVRAAIRETELSNEPIMAFYESAIADMMKDLEFLINSEEGSELVDQLLGPRIQQMTESAQQAMDEESRSYAQKAIDALDRIQDKIRRNSYADVTGMSAIIDAAITTIKFAIRTGMSVSSAIEAAVADVKRQLNEKGITSWPKEAQFRKDMKEAFESEGVPLKKPGKTREKATSDKTSALKKKLEDIQNGLKNPDKYFEQLEAKREKAREAAERRQQEKTPEQLAIEAEIKIAKMIAKSLESGKELSAKSRARIMNEALDTIIEKGYLDEIGFRTAFQKAMGMKHLTSSDISNIRNWAQVIQNAQQAAQAAAANPTPANIRNFRNQTQAAQVANQKLSRYFQKRNFGDLISSTIKGSLLSTITASLSLGSNIVESWRNLASKIVAGTVEAGLYKVGQAIPILRRIGISPEKPSVSFIGAQKGYYKGAWLGFSREGVPQLWTGSAQGNIYERESIPSMHPLESIVRAWRSLSGKERQRLIDTAMDIYEGTFGVVPEVAFRLLNLTDKPFRRAKEMAVISELVYIDINKERQVLSKKTSLTAQERQLLDDINSGKEYMRRILNPGEDIMKIAEEEGEAAVFQNKNIIARSIGSRVQPKKPASLTAAATKRRQVAEAIASGIGKVIKSTTFPFVNMPLNWAEQLVKMFNPWMYGIEAIYRASEGDRRKAMTSLSNMVVSAGIKSVAGLVVAIGAATDSGDDDDEDERNAKREIEGGGWTSGYNRINISMIKRYIQTGDAGEWQRNDQTMLVFQMGMIGAAISTMANVNKQLKSLPPVDDYSALSAYLMALNPFEEEEWHGLIVSLRTALEMPTVQGLTLILDAINESSKENESIGVASRRLAASALTAAAAPASPAIVTKSVLSSSPESIKRDVKDVSILKWVSNSFKDRWDMGGGLPPKYTIWGEEIRKTPPGVNPWFYNVFDFTKSYAGKEDDFARALYGLAKYVKEKGGDSNDLIPNLIKKDNIFQSADGTKIKNMLGYQGGDFVLTKQGLAELNRIVGLKNREMAQSQIEFISSEIQKNLANARESGSSEKEMEKMLHLQKMNTPKIMSSAYDVARFQGMRDFLMKYSGNSAYMTPVAIK
jgi:hypothetical protein